MALLTPRERRVVEAIAGIGYCNPFLPERVELEHRALGDAFVEVGPVIWARPGVPIERLFPNLGALRERAAGLADELRHRLEQGRPASPEELLLYEDLALYRLYSEHMNSFDVIVSRSRLGEPASAGEPVTFWREFRDEFAHFLHIPGRPLPSNHDPAVIFAGYYQIERAFAHIFQKIVGGSRPAARLRAAAWESIFTYQMRRYSQILYKRMAPVTTLITGPSGTGKELVAQAIGRSRYLAFDGSTKRFAGSRYTPLNLSAFSPGLIESELFGHVKGAFNGALDRTGWLEQCGGPDDTVFLDEIGELDETIQVKLLRVLQERCFVRVGETTDRPRRFHGKIIAATNRDLTAAIRSGRFREDFYHRLCDDHIVTPSLAEQLADRPEDLTEMVRFLASQILGELTPDPDGPAPAEAGTCAREVDALTAEAVDGIERNLKGYPWPGNFRELSRCVRNIMIRGRYCPASTPRNRIGGTGAVDEFLREVREVELTADQLLERYCAMAYYQSDENSAATGRRLDLDPRVVKRRLDQAFLERLRRTSAPEAG
jgi:DNA-binding NtrC family response regulator